MSELDKYLNEATEPVKDDFNILLWWKVNSPRFPYLSLLARDVLAIPVSTVASESTFSTGGRVLDSFRSSLTPRMAQALVCYQDWIQNSTVSLDVFEELQELNDFESVENDSSWNAMEPTL
ncbi:zinc finger BED domain-containing protein RICESLEEPER 2-like [Ipomoea triloba]|uniref:zinc finger BED domain-containing protein RICESLEEPER 2-like n=1 Tax=Ipomoea triloba TaxID=35885 RepID=UPI00125D0F37|nr:zinc finger BED domain-containing protein RICESLEEPER 2-like [Ipomoea triloba]